MKRISFYTALLGLVLLIAACDSGDPIDQTRPSDVAGTYSFSVLTFDPNAANLPSYNLLDTLVTSETRLHLFDDGAFVLTYQFKGGRTYPINGTFSVSDESVQLARNSDSSDPFWDILFGTDTELLISGADFGTLTADIEDKRIENLGLFIRGYDDVAVVGTLTIRLRR